MAACAVDCHNTHGIGSALLQLSFIRAEQSSGTVRVAILDHLQQLTTRRRFPHTQNISLPKDDVSMATIIKALYGPILHPIDAANFTDEDGDIYRLAGEPKFKSKLGKKVLILDIDSRPLTEKGQLMDPQLKWKGMRSLSAGMLGHYMFGTFSTIQEETSRAVRHVEWTASDSANF